MKRIVFDLESNGLLDEVSVIHCAVAKDLDTHEVVQFTPDNIHKLPAYLDTVEEVICHNFIGYDKKVLTKILGYTYPGRIYDTVVISRMLSPNRMKPRDMPQSRAGPHSLEAWGYRVGRGKPEYTEWEEYDEAMLHRCTEDVHINELVYYELQEEMKEGDWSSAAPMTNKLFQVFDKIEEYGWKVDLPYMHQCIEELTAMQDTLLTEASPLLPYVIEDEGVVNKPFTKAGGVNATLVKWYESRGIEEWLTLLEEHTVGGPYTRVLIRKIDLNKRGEVVELLLAEGWLPEEWNTDDNGDRTSPKLSKTDPFDGVKSNLGKIAAKFIQVRHRKSLIEGLLKLVREDGRIPSRITGLADTSRVKHSGIVNIPNPDSFYGEEIRKIFIADEGKTLVGVDSAGNQVRQLCALMGDDKYEYEVLHGDIHSANQAAAGLEKRSQAKTFFYGFLFGAGDEKVGSIVGGGAKEGGQLKKQFLEGLPLLAELIDRLKEEWRSNASKKRNRWGGYTYYNGWVKGLDGRRLTIKSEHAILVYVLQNMEAIQMSYALLFAYKWLEESGLVWGDDYGIVCFYHDEINIECRPEFAMEIGEIVKKAIIYAGSYLKIKTPHDGDIKIGKDWMEIH